MEEDSVSGHDNCKTSDRIIFASFDFFSFYLGVITVFLYHLLICILEVEDRNICFLVDSHSFLIKVNSAFFCGSILTFINGNLFMKIRILLGTGINVNGLCTA